MRLSGFPSDNTTLTRNIAVDGFHLSLLESLRPQLAEMELKPALLKMQAAAVFCLHQEFFKSTGIRLDRLGVDARHRQCRDLDPITILNCVLQRYDGSLNVAQASHSPVSLFLLTAIRNAAIIWLLDLTDVSLGASSPIQDEVVDLWASLAIVPEEGLTEGYPCFSGNIFEGAEVDHPDFGLWPFRGRMVGH